MQSRRERRDGLPHKYHFGELDDDADNHEADIKGMTRLLVTFLVSVTLASVGLAAKIVFGG